MDISGHVTYVNLSGGFWGIVGSDGQQYQPTQSLPDKYCQEGMKIKASVTPASGVSIFMWGQQVNVQKISSM